MPPDAVSFPWLKRGSDLLAEPDPGPTPWLVDRLLVDRSLAAIVGPPKVWKTWVLLELAASITGGRDAFDVCPVTEAGPVIVVLEESGEAALHRRLDLLRRGRATEIEAFEPLLFAANKRVRLDDQVWRDELLAAGRELEPRAIMFDPLARLKSAARNESAQNELAVVLEFLRDLRDQTTATIAWVHHTGHTGGHMRGSSDLESVWESRIGVRRDNGIVALTADHREAESGHELRIRPDWDHDTRSLRLTAIEDGARTERIDHTHTRILAHLADHPGDTQEQVVKAIGGRAQLARKIIGQLVQAGTAYRTPSHRTDGAGRRRTVEGLFLSNHATPYPVPEDGTGSDALPLDTVARPAVPGLRKTRTGRGTRDGVPGRQNGSADDAIRAAVLPSLADDFPLPPNAEEIPF